MASTIQELITQIRNGEILLPEFQRGYVWKSDQVRSLVRALYKQRPTGHLLVWKTYRPSQIRGATSASDRYSLLLLDGQQRLTSLYVLFEGCSPPFYEGEQLFYNLYFNLQTEEFRFWQKSLMDGNPAWLGVHELLHDGLGPFLRRLPQLPPEQHELATEHLDRIGQLDAIRSYPYTVDLLSQEDLTLDEVIEIFNQVNSAGTPLTKADLGLAHICSVWPEARPELRAFSQEMGQHGFPVGLDFLLRCTAAVASGSLLLEGNFYKVPAEELQLAWKKVRQSVEYLVNVLRHEAYVDRLSDLPTSNVLISLTVYLARNSLAFSSEIEKRKFLRWMFLAGIWGRYSGSTETNLQRDISLLNDPDPTGRLVEAIIRERGRIHLEAGDLEGRGAGTPVYKFSYILARARHAKDWFTGLTLYREAVGTSNGLEEHHIFPKGVLYSGPYNADEHWKLVNEVANRVFLTQKANKQISASRPEDYLAEVEARQPGALQAQSLPMNRELWRVEAYEEFLEARRRLLAANMNAYLDGLVSEEVRKGDRGREIPELLTRGESVGLEFKSSMRWDYKQQGPNRELERVIAKTVAGFLNGRGGTLLIGVDDAGQVLGLERDFALLSKGKDDRDGYELHLMQILVRSLGAAVPAFVTVTFHRVDGHDVCQVVVDPSDHPVYLTEGQGAALFVRTGNATRSLPVNEAVKYVASRWGAVAKSALP